MAQPSYMLASTLKKLQEEFEKKRKKLKKDTAKDISCGYDTGGGWHDNALFESSLMDQAILASQLTEMSKWLEHPILIDKQNIPGDIVTLGTRVVLERRVEGKEPEILDYKILGPADLWYITEGAISYLAPLFEKIKLHKQGDVIRLSKKEEIKILEIESLFPGDKKTS